MGCSRSEKNGSTTSHNKTVTTQLPTRLLGNTNIDRTRPFEGSRLTLCTNRHSPQKIPGATLDSQSSFRDVGLLASRARLRFTRQSDYSTRRGEQRERWLHRPFFLRRRGPRVASQPDQPSGPADSAGVALIEAACVRETVEPEYSVSGPAGPERRLDTSRRNHEGMDMGCSRSEKNGATTSHSKTVTTQLPTRLLGNTNIDRTRPFEGSRLYAMHKPSFTSKNSRGDP